MSDAAGKIGELDFLTKLQRILNEGIFTASYKYALLLALAELSVEKTIALDGSLRIELDDLAERFITLYWRQVAPFGGADMLAQNTGRQASAVNKIAALRAHAPIRLTGKGIAGGALAAQGRVVHLAGFAVA